jgi:AbrB family looped-hinge helix DNA binding protein
MQVAVKIDRAGRVLVPLKLRRELGIEAGAELILRLEDGELRMYTRQVALRRVREALQRLKRPGDSVVDEVLAGRRQEAERELREMDS